MPVSIFQRIRVPIGVAATLLICVNFIFVGGWAVGRTQAQAPLRRASASRGIAGRLAGQGGDAEALLKTEMVPNLLPNSRLVAAGVVGVLHAQERGFRLLFVG